MYPDILWLPFTNESPLALKLISVAAVLNLLFSGGRFRPHLMPQFFENFTLRLWHLEVHCRHYLKKLNFFSVERIFKIENLSTTIVDCRQVLLRKGEWCGHTHTHTHRLHHNDDVKKGRVLTVVSCHRGACLPASTALLSAESAAWALHTFLSPNIIWII